MKIKVGVLTTATNGVILSFILYLIFLFFYVLSAADLLTYYARYLLNLLTTLQPAAFVIRRYFDMEYSCYGGQSAFR